MRTLARRLLTVCPALSLPVLLLIGCDAIAGGGGGATHKPPESIALDAVTSLRLQLSVNGFGNAADRYAKVRCHYKPEAAASFIPLPGRIEEASGQRVTYVFDLPRLSEADGKFVEYFFDAELDGHYNKGSLKRVRYARACRRAEPPGRRGGE